MTTRFIGLFAAAIGLLAACSSTSGGSSTTPCNENPFECTSGQTCWPKDAVPTFACLNSGPGKKGDSCQNTPGSATCGDGLACLQLASAGGTCVAYCDSTNTAHACASGETCTLAYLGGPSGPQLHLCVGGSPPHNDAGTDSGAADSSTPPDGTAD